MTELADLKTSIDAVLARMTTLEAKAVSDEHKATRDVVAETHSLILDAEENIKRHISDLLHTPKRAAWIALLIGAIGGTLLGVFLVSLRHVTGG